MANRFSLLLFFSIYLLAPCSAVETSSDLVAAESISSSKTQSVAKYGYPYMIAPTLGPRIEARSDDDESGEPVYVGKSYGSRITKADEGDVLVKKGSLKKTKTAYEATRRQDGENPPAENQRFRSYKEPKYRNFEELEESFQPRRMDINIPYSQYDYSKFLSKPSLSPRDPFLSPAKGPIDSFYQTSHKAKSYPPSAYGHRNQVRPTYGAGNYGNPLHYNKDIPSGGSFGGPSPSYPSPAGPSSGYPSSGGGYDYQDYAIKSNEPIIGNIRKRLLDYAGASDLYEGEPDYLQEVARNKHKYGNIGNDYYAYGGPVYKDSYRDFPYVESKITMIKKSGRA